MPLAESTRSPAGHFGHLIDQAARQLCNDARTETPWSALSGMRALDFLPSILIGAVASARSMTPMATLAAANFARLNTPGRLWLLDRPLFTAGALVMGAGELYGDKMESAPDRTVFLGLLARVMSAAIAGAALAPRGSERTGAAIAVGTAVPAAYATLAARKRAMAEIGQTKSGLIEDVMVVGAGIALVAWATRRRGAGR